MNRRIDLPSVSVVIPTRDRPELLQRTLESLLGIIYPSELVEVIVSDNSPQKAAQEVVKSFASVAPFRVLYLGEPEAGANRNRNRALREVTGDLVWLFDDDRLARSNVLETLVAALVEDADLDAVAGGARTMRDGESWRGMCAECLDSFKSNLYPAPDAKSHMRALEAGNTLVRVGAFADHGVFEPKLSGPGDESEWFIRAGRGGAKFALIQGAWVWHLVTPGQAQFGSLMRYERLRRRNFLTARKLGTVDNLERSGTRQSLRFLGHGIRRRCNLGIARGLGGLMIEGAALLRPPRRGQR
ncbi:MAG TPA: glycosyltransferase [Actinomycetota bacterium]|nr:glycosyltransferase [Actinomycetota bacterium]